MNERKAKLCRAPGCEITFEPYRSTQIACSMDCAIEIARHKKKRQYDQETRRLKREFRAKDRSYQLKKAQQAFNAYIRERDNALPCISSGRTTGQMHAGHYKSIGAYPELRFNEYNCNKQSMKDNSWLSGNIMGYREGLIKKYGLEVVEWLEGPHEPLNLTLEEIIEIKNKYRKKLKKLQENS